VKAKIQTLIGMHGFPRLELPGEPVILKVLCMGKGANLCHGKNLVSAVSAESNGAGVFDSGGFRLNCCKICGSHLIWISF